MSNDNLTMTERLSQVATRANALCQTVEDQVGVIQSTLSETVADVKSQTSQAISTAQVQFSEFRENADDRFSKRLEGDSSKEIIDLEHLDENTFYALSFYYPKMLDVRLERYVHLGGDRKGLLEFQVQLQNWSSGGDFHFAIQKAHAYSVQPFVAKVLAASTPYTSSIWLRGGFSYLLYTSGRYSKRSIIEAETQVVEKIGDTDYYLPPVAEVHSSVVPNRYIRGN
ncbi:hypothetical protein [Pseudoalteromonas piscicida]|uniref:Uncharacterized protein n=1 Tax=Pseudoalteromonas piscicida TaxID=43662 RepID=A0A2A5JUF5_PSEO7|nr:hypothetical protein [Pseudoalteromonas piscicida]PCK33113.1 hypothetical protein CEX98_03450 [Pseudoalteromonas piscicida]